ncbi:UNVERIFIED_CONTAM: hypothetical protein K2H54_049416 [Gekko kuhli]
MDDQPLLLLGVALLHLSQGEERSSLAGLWARPSLGPTALLHPHLGCLTSRFATGGLSPDHGREGIINMTQRLLVKLDTLKKYTVKRLAKYEKVESPSLGKVQLSPFVKTPLLVELKLDYELSPAGKSSFLASTERVTETSHISAYYQDRPKSVSAAHITRKKPALRPSSAPKNLKAKQSDKKGVYIKCHQVTYDDPMN